MRDMLTLWKIWKIFSNDTGRPPGAAKLVHIMWFWSSESETSGVSTSSGRSASGESNQNDVLRKALRGDVVDKDTKEAIASHQNSQSTKSMRDLANNRAKSIRLSEFPKEMSCLTAMDELLECMSMGGQIRNYYRYGDFTMCDKQTKKLDFCIRNKGKTEEEKEKNVQQYYKDKLVEKLKRGSSEDIWESRR